MCINVYLMCKLTLNLTTSDWLLTSCSFLKPTSVLSISFCIHYVEFNGVSSESCEIKCGVPRGFILGPLLFLLYINNLCNVSKVVDFILFADDTKIFFSQKDFNLLPGILNSEMLKLTQWCRANKLFINFKKSNFIVFRPPQRRQTLDISIQIDNDAIERVKETVFLGVLLDEHLSWKRHFLSVSRKILKSISLVIAFPKPP